VKHEGEIPRQPRRDRLIHEHVHDPYKTRLKLPEPTVCPQCGAVFREGRWHWLPPLRPTFEGSIKFEFHGAKITSDCGVLAYCELRRCPRAHRLRDHHRCAGSMGSDHSRRSRHEDRERSMMTTQQATCGHDRPGNCSTLAKCGSQPRKAVSAPPRGSRQPTFRPFRRCPAC
jgi:hypothetical protein